MAQVQINVTHSPAVTLPLTLALSVNRPLQLQGCRGIETEEWLCKAY